MSEFKVGDRIKYFPYGYTATKYYGDVISVSGDNIGIRLATRKYDETVPSRYIEKVRPRKRRGAKSLDDWFENVEV